MNKRRLHPLEVADASEVLHLKLWEGTAFDYSLNNHPGTLKETAAYKYPGVDLDGDSDYIEVADHVDFTPILTPFSISTWVNMRSFVYFIPASKWQDGSNEEWLLYTGTQKKIIFHMYDNSEDAYIGRTYGTSLDSYKNKWTHFAATYDGGTLSSGINIYLNGNKVDDADSESVNSFIEVENLSAPVWIGRYSANYSNGLIDDVRIYTTERSAAQIKDFYEQTRWRYGV